MSTSKHMGAASRIAGLGGAALIAGAAACLAWPAGAQEGASIPAPVVDETAPPRGKEVAVLAGGCFWGVQGVFQRVEGVSNAVSGYAGGEADTARYEQVGSGTTGHAEAVKITFDPKTISYGQILQIFFSVAHDPTQLDRQGPDTGSQYRTAIFPQSGEQAEVAKHYIAQLDKARVFDAAIVTKIEPGRGFYPAEAYHQDYLTLNPDQPYIVVNDLPKIGNLKKLFPKRYRDKPVLTTAAAGAGG
jgi:peptide-methionine (S)-S-oxide reductase